MESELQTLILKLQSLRKNSALRSYYEEEVLNSLEQIALMLKNKLTPPTEPQPETVCYKTCRCGVKDCKGSEAI